jgi:RimJ/RimL family protein N-acetyltransferase
VPDLAPFIGFVGLSVPRFEAPFTPCVEVGWRIAAEYWGRGYAPEAARGALAFGFDTLGLREILSFTTVVNQPSRRVMEKLGMVHDPSNDFDHPALPEGHALRRHVLYRIARP